MENFFSLLELETQNAIKNYVNNEIDEFLELSCENPHLMDFMTGGNYDSLYTVTSDITKKNKKFKCDERTIQLKASNKDLNSFEEAVDFCHNY